MDILKWTPRTGAQLRTPNSLYQPWLRTSSLSRCFVWVWILTAAGEPWPLRRGSVVAAGPVYTLDALVPIDDLEDLTDECTGLLSSILVQGRKRAQLLPTIRAPLLPQRQCVPGLRHPTPDSLKSIQDISPQNYMAPLLFLWPFHGTQRRLWPLYH